MMEPSGAQILLLIREGKIRDWNSLCAIFGISPDECKSRTYALAKRLQQLANAGLIEIQDDFDPESFEFPKGQFKLTRNASAIQHALGFSLSKLVNDGLRRKDENLIDLDRIARLSTIQTLEFDLSKLIQICKEINQCYDQGCFLSVAMLARAMIDHVPPIFGCNNFSEVANNYQGSKSFKQSMQILDASLRKISDAYLHTQIRKKESLPNKTQVNFANDIDVLLAEIERVIKRQS